MLERNISDLIGMPISAAALIAMSEVLSELPSSTKHISESLDMGARDNIAS
jgi:hypothetical protein